MAQKSSMGSTVLWVFFIIPIVGKSLALAIQGQSWLTGTKESASFIPRQEIFYGSDDTMRTGRSALGKRKSFEHLPMKRVDREERLNGVKASSNNIVGGRDLRLYCRFSGKCNIAEKHKVSGFAFAADYGDPQRHPPRHNFMKTKH